MLCKESQRKERKTLVNVTEPIFDTHRFRSPYGFRQVDRLSGVRPGHDHYVLVAFVPGVGGRPYPQHSLFPGHYSAAFGVTARFWRNLKRRNPGSVHTDFLCGKIQLSTKASPPSGL